MLLPTVVKFCFSCLVEQAIEALRLLAWGSHYQFEIKIEKMYKWA